MKTKINVGIIGAGGSGINIHGRLLEERKNKFEIKSFCDIDKEKLKIVKEKFGCKTFDNIENFLNQEDLEVVIIATRPHSTHFPIAVECMRKKKNVVVEKPMCITTKEAEEMIRMSKENNVLLFPFQNQRWNLSFMIFKEAIEKKIVGELRYIEVKRYVDLNYKGHIYEFMPHLIDCILFLLNFEKVVEISAVVENPEESWDKLGYVYSLIRFESGVVVSISQLPDETIKTPHFYWYACGTEGSFYQENIYNRYDLMRKCSRFSGKANEFITEVLETRLNENKKIMADFTGCFYDNVYEVIMEGKEPIVKPEHVLQQIFIIEKIIESGKRKEAIKI